MGWATACSLEVCFSPKSAVAYADQLKKVRNNTVQYCNNKAF